MQWQQRNVSSCRVV